MRRSLLATRLAAVTLTITADGGLDYKRTSGVANTSVQAPVQVWADDHFDAGIGPLTTSFHIDAPPHQDGDVWKMTVDGVELTRGG